MVGVMLSFCNNRQLLSSCDRFIYLHEKLLWLNKLLFVSLKWYFEFNKVSWMATLRYENSFGRITIMIFQLNFHECKKIGLNQSSSHWCHASWSRCYVIDWWLFVLTMMLYLLQCIDISSMISEAIRRTHHGESVSYLFYNTPIWKHSCEPISASSPGGHCEWWWWSNGFYSLFIEFARVSLLWISGSLALQTLVVVSIGVRVYDFILYHKIKPQIFTWIYFDLNQMYLSHTGLDTIIGIHITGPSFPNFSSMKLWLLLLINNSISLHKYPPSGSE